MPRKRLFCQENDTRSGRRFACRLYPSHGPLRFITSHSFRVRLCHAKNEAPEGEAGVEMFFFLLALITQARIWKSFVFKTRQVYFIYPFLPRLKRGNSLQTRCVVFFVCLFVFIFSLKLTFKARKIRILESIFLQNNWLRVRGFVYKTLRLVRISRLITKSFAFFLGEVIL